MSTRTPKGMRKINAPSKSQLTLLTVSPSACLGHPHVLTDSAADGIKDILRLTLATNWKDAWFHPNIPKMAWPRWRIPSPSPPKRLRNTWRKLGAEEKKTKNVLMPRPLESPRSQRPASAGPWRALHEPAATRPFLPRLPSKTRSLMVLHWWGAWGNVKKRVYIVVTSLHVNSVQKSM